MKHLKLFKDNTSYDLYKNSDNFVLPNVSHVVDTKKTWFNPLIKEKPIVLRATYNAVDDGENGMLCYSNNNNIKSIKIDNVNPFGDIVEHNNTYELNDSNIVINWDEWTADCPDEVMFNGRVNSLTLTPKDNSIVLSQESFDNGEISIGYVYIDKYDNNKYIDGHNISPDEWNFDASSNSISLNDVAINEDWFSYYDCAMFLVKYTNDMDFPEIIDTVSVVNYTTGFVSMKYSFETEGIHEVEFVLKDNFIGDWTFSDCSSLTEITIPEAVTSIGEVAFGSCSSLTEITIPDTVTSIGSNAFAGCSSLTSITIPEAVTSIEYATFYNCSSLTEITIPDSVTSIDDSAFGECSGLTSVIIGNGVTSIGSSAFSDCISLTSVNIPDSVIKIEFRAFSDCSSLTSVTIPNSVTSLEESAFTGCTGHLIVNCNLPNYQYSNYGPFYNSKFTKLTIGDSVTSIGRNAFYGCSSLTEITIPNSVTSIGGSAFGGCSGHLIVNCNLPSRSGFIDCPFYMSLFRKVTIGDSVTSIGSYTFYYCEYLTSVTIPNSVTEIENNAFYGCKALTEITIPNSVTLIGNNAFYDCKALTEITIPNSVTLIGSNAFNSCTNLGTVYCKAITPPTMSTYVFDKNASGRKIYVPMNSVDAYKAAEIWSNYANDIEGYNF